MHPTDKVFFYRFLFTPVSKAADIRVVEVTVRAKNEDIALKKTRAMFKSPTRWRLQ